MEYVSLVLSALALTASVIILILSIKNRKTGDVALGDNELKKIRESVNESVNGLTKSISQLVAEKNSSQMKELNSAVDNLKTKINELEKSQKEMETSFNKFKEYLI
ncbi:MAG: hypothetical protein MJ248_01860, partial [Bacilli bacterium]|nr:hypothetical protein [Bacilli bacterium]